MKIVKETFGTIWNQQHPHHRGARRRRERKQGIEDIFEEITENFPNLMKEKHTSPRSTESPKQDEPKEAHTKAHHN